MFGIIMLPFDESNPSDCIRYQMEGLNKQTEFFMKKVESFESQEREDVTHVLGLSLDIQNVYAQIVDFSSIWCTGKISKYLMPLKKEEKQSEKLNIRRFYNCFAKNLKGVVPSISSFVLFIAYCVPSITFCVHFIAYFVPCMTCLFHS